jgi:hypothetical protein
MSRKGKNGRTFGKLRTISANSQSGIWDLYDAHQLKSNNTWGYVAPDAPKFNWRYYAYGSDINLVYIIWRQSDGSTRLLKRISGQQHTDSTSQWDTFSEDLSFYSGTTGRIYIVYVVGSGYRQDIQFDNMELADTTSGTISLDPGTSTGRSRWEKYDGYTTTFSYPTSYSSIPFGTSTSNIWNYDAGGTSSGGTGSGTDADGSSSGYYLYFEGSGSNYSSSTRYYWVRTTTDYTLL